MTGLEFAAVALVGVLIGRFLPNRRKGPEPSKPVEPICGCKHHRSYHDAATGKCGYASAHYIGEDRNGISKYENRHCPCLQYSGPEPLPEYFAKEVTS